MEENSDTKKLGGGSVLEGAAMPGDLETNGSSVRAFLNPNEEKIYRHKKKCGEKSLKSIVQITMCPFF